MVKARGMFASSGTTLKLPTGCTRTVENISTAVAAVLLSGLNGYSSRLFLKEFKTAKLQGRFEIRQIQNKTVIFDAGHNPHGVAFLLNQLRNYPKIQSNSTLKSVSVFSMLADKDVKFCRQSY